MAKYVKVIETFDVRTLEHRVEDFINSNPMLKLVSVSCWAENNTRAENNKNFAMVILEEDSDSFSD